jgi:nucleoid-associated protein YgaU
MIVVDPLSAPDPGHRDAFDFHNAGRASHSDQEVPLGGVPRALREAAELAGLEPLASLYNEALRYAQEGHLRLARERLQMLLCMAPDDGEARLMLARVHVAGQRWSDALTSLDEAASYGVDVPLSLRRAVEDHLRSERTAAEESTASGKARDQGELKALRLEARKLRSDNAQQQGQIVGLEREVRKWAWATAGVSALTIVFIVGSLVLGGAEGDAQPAELAAAPDAPAPAPVPAPAPSASAAAVPARESIPAPAPRPEPADPVDVEAAVRAALAEVRDLPAEGVTVRFDGATRAGGVRVTITGAVLAFRQRRAIERAVGRVSGVSGVDVSGVELLVRTRGAIHVVERGDTLTHLAYAYYGSSSLAGRIQEANGVDATVLRIGQKLTIPPLAR